MPSKPNILLITSDQQRGDCYGFEGRNIKTPHLDDMAARGTRFSACITPNVVCQPSRASILTGLRELAGVAGFADRRLEVDAVVLHAVGERQQAGEDARARGLAHDVRRDARGEPRPARGHVVEVRENATRRAAHEITR